MNKKDQNSPQKSLTDKVFRGFAWTGISSAANILVRLGVGVALARLIDPKEFGLMGMAMVFITLGNVISEMGMGPALIQKKNIEEAHVNVGFAVSLILGSVCAVVVFALSDRIAAFFEAGKLSSVIKVLSMNFIFQACSVPSIAMLQRRMRFRALFYIEISAMIIGFGLIGIVMALFDHGVWALVFANVSYGFCRTIFAYSVVRHGISAKLFGPETRELLRFGLGNSLTRLTNVGIGTFDNIVIGKLLGSEPLGLYLRAFQFLDLVKKRISAPALKVLFPAYSSIQTDDSRLGKAYLRSMSLYALATAPFLFMIFGIAEPLILGLFGPNWAGSVTALKILCLGSIFQIGYRICDSVVRAKGAVYRQFVLHFVLAVLIGTGAIVGSRWGINGVALGVSLSNMAMYFMMIGFTSVLIRLNFLQVLNVQLRGFLSGILAGFVAFCAAEILACLGVWHLAVCAITVFLTFILWLAAICSAPSLFMGPDGIWLLEKIKAVLPGFLKRNLGFV